MLYSIRILLSLAVIVAMATDGIIIQVDETVDKDLETVNRLIKKYGVSTLPLPAYQLDVYDIVHSQGMMLGLDSLYRTGKCKINVTSDGNIHDYHLGLRLLALVYPELTVRGSSMSAYLRVEDNSLRVSFTVEATSWKNVSKCRVSVDGLEVERLGGVTLWSTNPLYNRMDASRFFTNVIRTKLNRGLRTREIHVLNIFCHQSTQHHLLDVLKHTLSPFHHT